jgi:hypothetical protein
MFSVLFISWNIGSNSILVAHELFHKLSKTKRIFSKLFVILKVLYTWQRFAICIFLLSMFMVTIGELLHKMIQRPQKKDKHFSNSSREQLLVNGKVHTKFKSNNIINHSYLILLSYQ